jgi:desulfoferrodoxin (superoxide reductase-like protein)
MSNRSTRRGFIGKNGFLAAVTLAVPAWVVGDGTRAAAAAKKNPAWQSRSKELEGKGPIYTAMEPGKWKGKEGAHVPKATFESRGSVTIVTSHPMTPEHWITTHYIKNQNDVVIGLREFKGTDPAAQSEFKLPKHTTTITVYSYCNLHDLWNVTAANA